MAPRTGLRLKYADAVEEWCDLTKVQAKRRGPAIAARLSRRAEIFKERLNRDRLRDPETGVDYFLSTLRPFFVKDLQSVFLCRFFQMLRCNRGQTNHQRWMVKYEIARQKAVYAWLDATTPRPAADSLCCCHCRCFRLRSGGGVVVDSRRYHRRRHYRGYRRDRRCRRSF